MIGDVSIKHEEPWRGLLWLAHPPDWCEAPRHPGAQRMMVRAGNLQPEWRLFRWCDDECAREVKC